MVYIKHGEPMRYGKEMEKGLVLDKMHMTAKTNPAEGEVLVHDEKDAPAPWPSTCRACPIRNSRCRWACSATWSAPPTPTP